MPLHRLLTPLCAVPLFLVACSGGEDAASARTDAGGQPRANVLLVVVDTLRWDRLGCYGAGPELTPALDRLAQESVLFERAYAAAPWTMPSVASMITGLYPSKHNITGVRSKLSRKARTLAEILAEEGYLTGAVISHKLIGRTRAFDQGYEFCDEEAARGHERLSSPMVTKRALGMLDHLRKQDDPFFVLVHYFDPHYNYQQHEGIEFAAQGGGRLKGGEEIGELRSLENPTQEEIAFLRALYDEEVHFTDRYVGELLDGLRELGLFENTLVLFTADHGEEFFDHGWLGHTRSMYEEVVRVPLLVRRPGEPRAGRRVATPVSLVSITPTILDLLDLEGARFAFQADSIAPLLDADDATTREGLLVEVDFTPFKEDNTVKESHQKTWISGGYKLVWDQDTDGVSLFDLETDPAERDDLAAEQSALAERLLAELKDRLEKARVGGLETLIHDMSAEEEAALRAMGYIGGEDDG